jgi:hypothetical protein
MPLIGHGVGEAHFSLTPLVAEPASIGLLLAAVPLVLRRRRRCHS